MPDREAPMPPEAAKHPLFSGQRMGIMTGERPKFHAEHAGENAALKEHLQKLGLKHEPIVGHYDSPENSFVIHNPTRAQMYDLGKRFGQESVIFSEGGRHQLIHTNGPQEGKYYGTTEPHYQYFAERPENYFSAVPGGPGFFRLNFNFSQANPLEIHMPQNPNLSSMTQKGENQMDDVFDALLKADRFDVAEGHYHWLADHHRGAGSKEYSRLSKLSRKFKPGLHSSPEKMSTESKGIYDNLCNKRGCKHPRLGEDTQKAEGEQKKTVLGAGMSPAARAADVAQSDREYIAQRQAKEKAKAKATQKSESGIPELRAALLERLRKAEADLLALHKAEGKDDKTPKHEYKPGEGTGHFGGAPGSPVVCRTCGYTKGHELHKSAPQPGQNPSLPNPVAPDVNANPDSPVGAGNQVPTGQLGPEGQAEMETGGGNCPLCGQPDLPGKCMCLQGGQPPPIQPVAPPQPTPNLQPQGQSGPLMQSEKDVGNGWHVQHSKGQTVSWHKERTNADKEAKQLNYRGGANYTVVPGRKIHKAELEKVAPPGREEQVKALKPKVGTESAFKIAWSSYDKKAKKSFQEHLTLKKNAAMGYASPGITSQSTGGGGMAKNGAQPMPTVPTMKDESSGGASVSAPTSALKSELCKGCGQMAKMCKCVAKADFVDPKGKTVEKGVVGARPPAASGIKEVPSPGSGSVSDPKKNSHAVTAKAEPPMAKPPSGKNPATMTPAAKPAAPKAMGLPKPVAPKPMGGMPKPGMMGKGELDKVAPNPQMAQHALVAGSKAAMAPPAAAPAARPLQHPANLGRANAMQSALAGAFAPKGPVHSGLELARPPKVAAAGAGLKVPGVHKSEGCPFCGKSDHWGDCKP